MAAKKQKNILLSDEGFFFLGSCKAGTGYSDTKIMELCLALQSLSLRREVRRAHEFLYNNLVQAIASEPRRPKVAPESRKKQSAGGVGR